ncbi:hypothetical protein Hanom_Chr00s114375g01808851 [Helianthus anomalus]
MFRQALIWVGTCVDVKKLSLMVKKGKKGIIVILLRVNGGISYMDGIMNNQNPTRINWTFRLNGSNGEDITIWR